jgi:hypothetical protein
MGFLQRNVPGRRGVTTEETTHMRRALVAAVIATLALTGCGSNGDSPRTDETTSSTPSPTPAAADEATHTPTEEPSAQPSDEASDDDAIEIEIEGDRITPNGERITVGTGEKVTLDIRSDRAGELHVHSTPEQEIPFPKGETTHELTIDTPGVVDVEEHEADVVVLQLQVS